MPASRSRLSGERAPESCRGEIGAHRRLLRHRPQTTERSSPPPSRVERRYDCRVMKDAASLERLWQNTPPAGPLFDARFVSLLAPQARPWLKRAIAIGTPLSSAVRLRMHGEIRLRGWNPFRAEQVIRTDGSMIWRATVRLNGLPITGSDRLLDGRGRVHWKLLRLFTVAHDEGPEVTRSAIGRVQAESMWLPTMLAESSAKWLESPPPQSVVDLTTLGLTTRLHFTAGKDGTSSLALQRWGRPPGGTFGPYPFGAFVDEERSISGYTIPTKVRVGWHFGTPEFESEGEFFRATIDHAEFR